MNAAFPLAPGAARGLEARRATAAGALAGPRQQALAVQPSHRTYRLSVADAALDDQVAERGDVGEDVPGRHVAGFEGLQAEEKVSGEEALSAFCLVALNLNEFIYLD